MNLTRLGFPVSLAAFLQFVLASTAFAMPPPPPAGSSAPPAYPPPAAAQAPGAPAAPPGQSPPPAYPPPAYPPPAYPPSAYPPPAYPPGTVSPYPPGTVQPPYGAPVSGPIVVLHANHPRARLQQMGLRWEDICTVPCGIPANPAATYRVGGGTLRASDPFRLPRPSGSVLIDADVGSNVKHWVGFGLGLGGALSALVGVLTLATVSSTNTTTLSGTTTSDVNRGVGIAYLIVGGVLMAIGIPMWVSSNTSVEIH